MIWALEKRPPLNILQKKSRVRWSPRIDIHIGIHQAFWSYHQPSSFHTQTFACLLAKSSTWNAVIVWANTIIDSIPLYHMSDPYSSVSQHTRASRPVILFAMLQKVNLKHGADERWFQAFDKAQGGPTKSLYHGTCGKYEWLTQESKILNVQKRCLTGTDDADTNNVNER